MEKKLTIDLGLEASIEDIKSIESWETLPEAMTVFLPLPSFNKSNSHLDLRDDLLYASFSAELLATHALRAHAAHSFGNADYLERIELTISNPAKSILTALHDSYIVFNFPGLDEAGKTFENQYSALNDKIAEFEEQVSNRDALVPEIVDWYFTELIGAYYEMESEAPEFFQQEILRYPERRFHFHRSAYSTKLGAPCYVSPDSWLIPANLDLETFFKVTGQTCLLSDFDAGNIFLIENTALVATGSQIAFFPLNQYFKSLLVAKTVAEDSYSEMERFNWMNATFTHSAYIEGIRETVPSEFRVSDLKKVNCLVRQSGDLICVNDGTHLHCLYDTKPLNVHQVKSVMHAISNLGSGIASLAGITQNVTCDWKRLDDEAFEALCYDILYVHPKFDNETMRKLGKSRSRDGGRDIVVFERTRMGEKPKKWIFQCKLITDGSSLTARKLQDVGDMLEQHGAQGFGVMTSSVIDATLYDKLEAICKKRSIDENHYSVFELERVIARYPNIKKRYFRE